MDSITIARASAHQIAVSLSDTTGAPFTTLTSDDIPSAVLWGGDDQSPESSPACSYDTAPETGIVLVDLSGEDTDLPPGRYTLRILITYENGSTVEGARLAVDIQASPGAASPLKTYATYNDLLVYGPWLRSLQTADDQAGYDEQRARAREWIDEIIQAHVHHGTSHRQTLLWSYDPNPYLQGLLDDDRLIVTGAIREAASRYALYLIASSQVAAKDSPYPGYARQCHQTADTLMKRVVSVDTNEDGKGDWPIDCGHITTRRGR